MTVGVVSCAGLKVGRVHTSVCRPDLATALDGPTREERAALFGDRLEAEPRERLAAKPAGVLGALGRIHLVRTG